MNNSCQMPSPRKYWTFRTPRKMSSEEWLQNFHTDDVIVVLWLLCEENFLQPFRSSTQTYHSRGVARGVLGCLWPPLGRPSFEQKTYNIQVVKTPWQYLGHKNNCWKAHFFKICFLVKYLRQRLLSLVNIGLHAVIIWLSPLIHRGEQRYKPYIVDDPGWCPCCDPLFEKSWLRPCAGSDISLVCSSCSCSSDVNRDLRSSDVMATITSLKS